MRILLLGAAGQVGHELRASLAPVGQVVAATRSGVLADGSNALAADLSDADSLRAALDLADADVVVNAAAYTAVDRAESEPELAHRINAVAVGEIADWCATRQRQLIHYSTDYVFSGDGTRPYREGDPTGPLGVYGKTKLAGEQAIQSSGCRHQIFRTAWVYSDHGSNFLLTMLRLARDRDELRVVADQTGTPTSAARIADVTARSLSIPQLESGIYHLTAAGHTSWAGFAKRIFSGAQSAGLLDTIPIVHGIASSEYPTPARRPGFSRLDCSHLETCLRLELPEWPVDMQRTLARLASRRLGA